MDAPAVRNRLGTWTLVALALSVALLAIEWDHYRRVIRLGSLPHTGWDRVVIAWMLAAKTLVVCAAVLLGAALERASRRRAAGAAWGGGLTGIAFWLLVDLRVQQTTGRSLASYAGFLLEPATFRWAGGAAGALGPVVLAGLAAIVLVSVSRLLGGWVMQQSAARFGSRSVGAAALACGVALIGGALAAQRFAYCNDAVRQLGRALPISFPIFVRAEGEYDRFRAALQEQLTPLLPDLAEAPPADEQTILPAGKPPHVVVIVLESLRHDALTPEFMPRLAAWADVGPREEPDAAHGFTRGIHSVHPVAWVLPRHYSGSNCSHLGIFSLLYARSPAQYEQAVGKVAPQACVSLRRSGYECSFLTSGTLDYRRMNEFVRRPDFDRVEVYNHEDDWPRDDLVVLRRAGQLLQSERPQFLVLFLMSTHFPYRYPPGDEVHRPVLPAERMLQATPSQKDAALNRYRNAARFLDREVAGLVSDLDPQRHLIVVAGDHGESIFDDGALTHWNKLSEQQFRTPLVMVGPGVPRQQITTPTTHADLLPTLLHMLAGRTVRLEHCHGRDLLACAPLDVVWLCTKDPSGPSWEGLLIRGDKRLALRFGFEPPWVDVVGFVDAKGRFDPRRRPRLEEADAWAAAFETTTRAQVNAILR